MGVVQAELRNRPRTCQVRQEWRKTPGIVRSTRLLSRQPFGLRFARRRRAGISHGERAKRATLGSLMKTHPVGVRGVGIPARSSPLRQRVDPVLARTRSRYRRVRRKARLCEITIAACRDRDVLASVHFIHRGDSFRSGREIESPREPFRCPCRKRGIFDLKRFLPEPAHRRSRRHHRVAPGSPIRFCPGAPAL